jgi:hypothetical protein
VNVLEKLLEGDGQVACIRSILYFKRHDGEEYVDAKRKKGSRETRDFPFYFPRLNA